MISTNNPCQDDNPFLCPLVYWCKGSKRANDGSNFTFSRSFSVCLAGIIPSGNQDFQTTKLKDVEMESIHSLNVCESNIKQGNSISTPCFWNPMSYTGWEPSTIKWLLVYGLNCILRNNPFPSQEVISKIILSYFYQGCKFSAQIHFFFFFLVCICPVVPASFVENNLCSIELPFLLSQRSVDYIYMGLFLGPPFSCIDLFICSFANFTLSCLLQFYITS